MRVATAAAELVRRAAAAVAYWAEVLYRAAAVCKVCDLV